MYNKKYYTWKKPYIHPDIEKKLGSRIIQHISSYCNWSYMEYIPCYQYLYKLIDKEGSGFDSQTLCSYSSYSIILINNKTQKPHNDKKTPT